MFPPPLTQRNEFGYASLAERFSLSSPVRHVVIDDFLDPEVAELLYEDFPDQGAMPKSRDYLFSDKTGTMTTNQIRFRVAIVGDACILLSSSTKTSGS